MCTGIEIAVVAGAVLSTGAAIHQSQVQSNYKDYQADQAAADAAAAKGAAQVEAERIQKAAKQQRSEAVAALAASGVDVNSSTALKIDQTITGNAANDSYLTLAGADDRAARLNAQSQGFSQQAGQAANAGYVSAAGSLLQGATNNGRGWKS